MYGCPALFPTHNAFWTPVRPGERVGKLSNRNWLPVARSHSAANDTRRPARFIARMERTRRLKRLAIDCCAVGPVAKVVVDQQIDAVVSLAWTEPSQRAM